MCFTFQPFVKSAKKVFVGQCTEDITEDDLHDYFGKYGEITDVFIPKPFRGFGFVTFNEPDVVASLTGRDHTINNTKVTVTEAIPRSTENPKYSGVARGAGGHGWFDRGDDNRRSSNRYDNYGSPGGYNSKWVVGNRGNDSWSRGHGYGGNSNPSYRNSGSSWKQGGASAVTDPNFIATVVNQAVAGVLSNIKGGSSGGSSGTDFPSENKRWSKWEC